VCELHYLPAIMLLSILNRANNTQLLALIRQVKVLLDLKSTQFTLGSHVRDNCSLLYF
jgi:hypothetical protein